METSTYQSWGRYPQVAQDIIEFEWPSQNPFAGRTHTSFLPYGQGRSYGDCCLNDGGALITTARLNRFISWDQTSGILRCEAGVTLSQILSFCVARGWFLPVSPGTQFVSVGGAIANDIHGKNHHRAGTFGCHVKQFELLRSNGERLICSPREHEALFRATIGGLGLSGLIVWADVQLKQISSPYIRKESVRFANLDEFFALSADSNTAFEYTVAWLDCVSAGKSFGRGIFMRGNHVAAQELPSNLRALQSQVLSPQGAGFLVVPFDAPTWTLNRFSMRAFNSVYYHRQWKKTEHAFVPYEPFFYPLDAIRGWNRIYGRNGFMQFQCVLPSLEARAKLRELLTVVVRSGQASFLAVLKEFGAVPSPGLLSFPHEGVTLCLDFPNLGQSTLQLLSMLENMVCDAGGRLYPAKDACMSGAHYQTFYPKWQELLHLKDPACSSSLWRRVTTS